MYEEAIEGFRLSPQQRRVWRLQELRSANETAAQVAAVIEGALKPELLKQAIEQTVNRHEILRTTFRLLPEMELPLQVIGSSGLVWRAEERHGKDKLEELPEAIESLLEAERQQPVESKGDGVFRASLFALTEGQSLLLITVPALCADLLTLRNLLVEIGNEYEALGCGSPYSIEPMQYADISEWENELLAAEDAKPGKEYWRRRRVDGQAARSFKLPYEKRNAATAGRRMSSLKTTLNAEATNLIEETARANDCSAQAVLLACWQALLWKLSGEELIMTATAFDGRQYAELEPALGLLVRHLPIGALIEKRQTFAQLAIQLDAELSEARKWQEYFFVEDDSAPLDEAQQTRVGFEYMLWPPVVQAADISIKTLKLSSVCENFDLKLACFRLEDSIRFELAYDGASFDAETIARLAANLQTLIKSALREPSAALSSLEILSTDERRLLIEEFNETATNSLPARFVHEEFERQANELPFDVAAAYLGEQLTYGELNERANQLAHYLQAQGVGPDVLVGICLARSFDMLVAMLGILKAGGAYLPLDASYPKERLAFMIDDAGVRLLITARKQSALLPQTVQTLLIDTERELLCEYGRENPARKVEPENLAYVIYTSGSTGQPKGVMISHGGLINYLSWCTKSYRVHEGQGSPVHSPLTFDLTLTSIFPALLTGKRLLLLDEEQAAGEALASALSECEDFSLVKLTPAHLEWLAHSLLPNEATGSTRALIIGGEALYAESLSFWRTHSPATRIINEYGPTESVVGCCVYEVLPEEQASGAVAIGRPIANTQLYILDEELRPTPFGVAGEIYIGGAGLARGYLNKPELTAEKFIPDPFGRHAGQRLYQTGDRGRVRPDGIIEYLGRTDYQLKIKGYRIEPGEIEAVLCGHAGVREAVVIARGEKEEKQLVGYVVAHGGDVELSEGELRGYLRERVPEYMIPSFLIVLDYLPLTPNGKVDREALPPPEQRTRSNALEAAAPRNRSEEILASIWAEILGVEQVGINDNFFELGGDSIRGIQAIARANRAGIKLTPQQLFEQQTIAGLASVAGSAPVVRTEQHVLSGPVVLTPIQRWFFERNLAAPQEFNQSILLESRRPLELPLLEESARLLLAHHDSLRLRFSHTPSGWQQAYASANDAPPVSQVIVSAATEAEYAAAIEMAVADCTPFDLSMGPLLRFMLFRSTEGLPDRLHIKIHHLLMDGVSWRILLEDLELCLSQLSRGESVRLPPKTTSYQYWAAKLADYAQSETLRQESAYWISEAASPAGRLPIDFANEPDNSTPHPAQTVSISLDVEETSALLRDVPQSYRVQINDLLLTALARALARMVRADSLLICMESHGRQDLFGDVDLSRTTGWFTALFPFNLTLPQRSADIGDQLKTMKEQLRRVPNHGAGYGLLRYLNGDAELTGQLAGLPQPVVLFNYLGNFDQVLPASSLLSLRPESRSYDRRRTSVLGFQLEINASVLDGQLSSDWTYDATLYRRATIAALAEGFNESLRLLIEHCRGSETTGYTPSDFPKSGLNQTELDQLLSKLRATRGETA